MISPIHPIRRFQLDPTLPKVCEYYRHKYGDWLKKDQKEGAQAGTHVVAHDFNIDVLEQSCETPQDFYGEMFKFQYGLTEEVAFVRFWDGPRQIFSFDRDLAEALAKTDVDEIPFDQLRLPYDSFFIHFPPILLAELRLGERIYKVDGAYLKRQKGESILPDFTQNSIHVRLTTTLMNMRHEQVRALMPAHWKYNDPVYSHVLVSKPGATIGDSLRDGSEANLRIADETDHAFFETVKNVADAENIDSSQMWQAHAFRERYARGVDLIRDTLPLIVNCVFYLSHVAAPTEPSYPDDAPKHLLKKLEKEERPSRRKILLKQLEQRGYTKLHFVSHAGLACHEESGPSGKTVRAHWRRGHWRMQPYGEKLSLIKLIWIKPVMIHADQEEAHIGRVYEVRKDQKVEPSPAPYSSPAAGSESGES